MRPSPLELAIAGPLVSQPYIRMTLAVMKSFGVEVETDGLERFRIAAPLTYRADAIRHRARRFGGQLFLGRRGHLGRPSGGRGTFARRVCKATSPFAIAWRRWAARSSMAPTE